MLDSGYRCTRCGTKAHLNLWHTISPRGVQSEQILCLTDAVRLEARGWKVEAVPTPEQERTDAVWAANGVGSD